MPSSCGAHVPFVDVKMQMRSFPLEYWEVLSAFGPGHEASCSPTWISQQCGESITEEICHYSGFYVLADTSGFRDQCGGFPMVDSDALPAQWQERKAGQVNVKSSSVRARVLYRAGKCIFFFVKQAVPCQMEQFYQNEQIETQALASLGGE